MTPHFDPTKPVKTRDGRKARILATDLKDDTYPIAAAVTQADGTEFVLSYMGDGKTSDPTSDLVNLPDPPAALNFSNGVGVRTCGITSGAVLQNYGAIQLGRIKEQSWATINGADVPALINWLQLYLASRR